MADAGGVPGTGGAASASTVGAGGDLSGSRTPAEFLKAIKGKPVLVKLNSGVDYRGKGRALCGLPRSSIAWPLITQGSTMQVSWPAWMAT